ncbi:uncharacterized protein EV422DRAFT_538988 [Fimicolochytrium jonesii]|uniref:uncharacterized protein n=1 Tax=Fimicolochytrium jonesii TaxID=1396493 RepID=UPI0022FE89F4|nr:uncharacterized protein EV422DRAFT_538988 [Fimicolochytrium jonesii]KAI8818186.1 hypothetical protein EV422DRAFT_538988 [Fimicolochytrium jonesii]
MHVCRESQCGLGSGIKRLGGGYSPPSHSHTSSKSTHNDDQKMHISFLASLLFATSALAAPATLCGAGLTPCGPDCFKPSEGLYHCVNNRIQQGPGANNAPAPPASAPPAAPAPAPQAPPPATGGAPSSLIPATNVVPGNPACQGDSVGPVNGVRIPCRCPVTDAQLSAAVFQQNPNLPTGPDLDSTLIRFQQTLATLQTFKCPAASTQIKGKLDKLGALKASGRAVSVEEVNAAIAITTGVFRPVLVGAAGPGFEGQPRQ